MLPEVKYLTLSPQAHAIMVAHAEQAYPDECCGFFYGKDEENSRAVEIAVPVDNSKEGDQRRRFEIAPGDYMKAEHYAIEKNLTLLGVYHSHPEHPAIASEHDLKQALPFFSYIILSLKQAVVEDIKSWILDDDGKFCEEEVKNKNVEPQ